MDTYVSKPSEVQAIQYLGEATGSEVQKALGTFLNPETGNSSYVLAWRGSRTWPELWVEANQSWLPITVGEWILKDSIGYYPCRDEIFKKKYEMLRENHDEDTLVKVEALLRSLKAVEPVQGPEDIITELLNNGILFRERV